METHIEKIIICMVMIKSRINKIPKIINSLLNKKTLPDIIDISYSNESKINDDGIDQKSIDKLMFEIDNIKNVLNCNQTNIIFTQTENIGPYRKLIPFLKKYDSSIIITIDDDEIFESDIVGDFLQEYKIHNCIICSSARIIDLNNLEKMSDTIEYYTQIYKTDKKFMNLLPEGYGGILYHTDMFSKDFININYTKFDKLTLCNDDLFIRLYTYNLNIPVYIKPVFQSNMYNLDQTSNLFRSNKKIPMREIFIQVKKEQTNLFENNNNNTNLSTDIYELLEYNKNYSNNNVFYKLNVHTSTDVKKLQYKPIVDSNDKVIDLNNLIQKTFFKSNSKINTILINIEKDSHRYDSAIGEFKKILITDFVHLKATYWKEKEKFIMDMNEILIFLKQFNNEINVEHLNLNLFSEFNDKNIVIQDGPLGCYCSHLRALIYGYQNFENYTIIVEDDININDIESIIKNIPCIPDDWDMICFGASPINKFYGDNLYKFTDLFHSTHFYIVKNKSLETIFKKVYPIYDQIDILLAQLHNELNIYNIPSSISQKNFETNTQNNLFVIYNSPNYEYMRTKIDNIKKILTSILVNKYKILTKYNNFVENIKLKILFDVLFNNITFSNVTISNDGSSANSICNMKRTLNNKNDLYVEYFIDNYKKKIDLELEIIINSCIKGIDVKEKINDISNDIFEIIDKFELANQLDDKYNCNLIPLNYGSTSNIFLLENKNIVLKVYNDSLRWKCTGHENSFGILTNEIQILNKIKKYNNFQNILYTNNKNKIYFTYLGETLFDNFNLPENWKNQITDIFEILDKENIYYPEFNIKNIICSNSQLYLIDFGLAKISEQNNKTNLFNHIELLSVLDEKFKTINDKEKQYVFYNNFISNLKSKNLYSENIF